MHCWLSNGIGGEIREGGEGGVYVVPCDKLTGLAIFDGVVLCTYTAHVVNLKGRMGMGGKWITSMILGLN